MEKLLFLYLLLPLFLTLQFYPVPILSHPYNFPDKFFINCGSGSSLPQSGKRKFVGDKNPNSFSVGISKSVQDTNQSTTEWPLYETARFYRRPFSYEFNITDKGLHAVRLHFFPFLSNKANLADALFNVSASNKSLVSNLSFRNITYFPLIKDFLVPINSASFRIHFIAAFRTSFAFVNAIEVFRVPNLKDNRIHVTSTRSKGPFKGLTFQVLRTVMRVNVGGNHLGTKVLWHQYAPWLTVTLQSMLNKDSGFTAIPFYYDFVVDSGDSDFIGISVVLGEELATDKYAYLSGLEIMEFIKEPGLELEIRQPKGKRAIFIITGSVIGFLITCGLLVFSLLCKTLYGVRTLRFLRMSSYLGTGTRSVNPPPIPNLKMSFAEIVEATKNFEAKLLIGKGGFGKVYRGILRNGLKVAVKRSESKHGQSLPEFQTEVMVLSRIRHRHFVALIGYCNEGPEMILVYELMEKGNLRDHLYKLHQNLKKSSILSSLTWNQRLEICIRAAEGLHYLHTSSDGGIIHRDVKSTNILLDEGYVAKVADFGLSKSGLLDPAERNIGIKGSFGYLNPEYFKCLQFTEKSDVYSFGVVLLEVLCARPAILTSQRMEEINLAEWGLSWLKKGELEQIIDPSVAGQININSLRKFSEIVEKCLKPTGASRPTMHDVCWDLKYTLQLQQTAVCREPHEDSAIDPSLDSSSPTFQHLPSNSFPMEKDYVPMEKDDGSATTSSGVFSQLKIDDGR
ncbi:hypothetical protein Gogos_015153 [Gossypium gossypioides]|uniref:Protein kinase domain-containing protein n=1 Tax=Gossypium gossypioides TaxID=34282 RepID=A0A7J9C0Q3_GOSGO|nr:hypothetical protein [Gossypium gossypioides]